MSTQSPSPYCPHCMVWRGHKANCPLKDGSGDPESTDYSLEAYREFLKRKTISTAETGHTPDIGEINPWLKPHQKAVVQWAVRGGRRAIFASFGLGKTVIQLETIRLILEYEKQCKNQVSPFTAPAEKSTPSTSTPSAPDATDGPSGNTASTNVSTKTASVETAGRTAGGEVDNPLGLIVAPLGVRQEFKRDAETLGIDLRFIRSMDEVHQIELEFPDGEPKRPRIYLTNYETVRDGKLNPAEFTVTSLDEAAILRGFGGTKTFREFMRVFEPVKYRYVATATPDPNEYIELLAYAAYLGVMDVSAGKTRFFRRDSTKADKLTLHPHKVEEWWTWVATWALFLDKPSDLGFSDEGYSLPELEVIKHEVPVDHTRGAEPERDGQYRLLREALHGVTDAAREKRDTLNERVAKMREILDAEPDEHFLLWHDLEAERHAIKRVVPEAVCVWGSMKTTKQKEMDEREQAVIDFSDGRTQYLAGKVVMLGSGCNFQRHCARAIFVGIGFKFSEFLQAVHRIHRFLQTRKVEIHLIYAESERLVLENLMAKWDRHKKQVQKMSELIQQYGLSQSALIASLNRSLGVERVEVSEPNYTLVNNDCVEETHRMEENSVHLVLTSIPFCHDQDTQILTTRGWLSFGELSESDQVATMNPDHFCFEWQTPTSIVWEQYDGQMLHFGNRVYDLLVTPNHRMLAARRGPTFAPQCLHLVQAEQIAREYEETRRRNQDSQPGRLQRGWRTCLVPPNPGDGWRPENVDIPRLPDDVRHGHGVELYWIRAEDFMALAGWYVSEGHADDFEKTRSGGRISIAQVTDQGKRQEICDLFTRIGLPPSPAERQITVWCRNLAYFLIDQFGTGSKQKRIPTWVRNMHPELLKILRDTMMKGDGSGERVYISYSPELRDNFQEICLKTGWRAVVGENRVKTGSNQIYPEIRHAPERLQYSGMIGCATVPNGLLITRRNGMPCISGNSTQYEYSPNFSDFGHTDTNRHFFQQMDFLTPELYRVLKPGRLAAIHVKDRIVPGGITGLGFQTVYPFHVDCILHYQKHGFAFMGMKTIVTDVVRENNQTYRLGWTEQCKDGTKMGYGMPEYLLLFRKPPTDTKNAYADEPVIKSKALYSRSRWQIDAHGFMRSSGNRPLIAEDLEGVAHHAIFKLFRKYSLEQVYDFEHHVHLGEILEKKGILPVTFMLLQPQSWHPDVWTDITRMRTLNGAQSAKGKEMHLCPMQIDLADRVIVQNTQEGETVYDPFNGLGTVTMRAVLKKRKGIGVELSASYFMDSLTYTRGAALEVATPTLFDLIEVEESEYGMPPQEPEAVKADAPERKVQKPKSRR